MHCVTRWSRLDNAWEGVTVGEVMKRLAMARPDVAFTLEHEGRASLRVGAESDPEHEGRRRRLAAILGAEFAPNALELDQTRGEVRLSGFAGLPTLHRGAREHQHLFVNGRPVKDKLIIGAVRAAYQDLLARDRHPIVALFLDRAQSLADAVAGPDSTPAKSTTAPGALFDKTLGTRPRVRLALMVAFMSGLTSLGYQVLWTRLLASGTGNSTYVFTTILTIFLGGLALGAATFNVVRTKIRTRTANRRRSTAKNNWCWSSRKASVALSRRWVCCSAVY